MEHLDLLILITAEDLSSVNFYPKLVREKDLALLRYFTLKQFDHF